MKYVYSCTQNSSKCCCNTVHMYQMNKRETERSLNRDARLHVFRFYAEERTSKIIRECERRAGERERETEKKKYTTAIYVPIKL